MNETLLRQYADFAVRVGANPQPCQTLIINAPIEGAHFARLCVESAYGAGAKNVVVRWNDDQTARIRMQRTAVEVLEDVKPYEERSYRHRPPEDRPRHQGQARAHEELPPVHRERPRAVEHRGHPQPGLG